ncbi:DUF1294 domain-containing protein [Clostridium sp.]|uniref:DUF1294 domain-containing protein n=1 Tax=Clostridium sp. TaxID=1506 RepID=UPI002608CC4C|nr:DUF1294 domain-containing protein [Clostridium sp.]
MNNYILIYLLIINIISFISMYLDKQRAIKHKWRIQESTLLGLAILGGSIGSYLGMKAFRHKTKNLKFTLGVPFIILCQISLIIFLLYNYL